MIFGRNDLVQDAPISRIDLLVCRNTLMYFNAETQARILARFHFALADERRALPRQGRDAAQPRPTCSPRRPQAADLPQGAAAACRPTGRLRRGRRRRRPGAGAGRPRPAAQRGVPRQPGRPARGHRRRPGRADQPAGRDAVRRLRRATSAGRSATSSLLPAGRAARLHRAGAGRAAHAAGQRRRVRRAAASEVDAPRGPGQPAGRQRRAACSASALVFHDVTAARRLQDELEHANRQLETAYEELQSTNEELETTNEELQSTVEELETTNEELQSTNEELETMNEELQSTNDELQTINDAAARAAPPSWTRPTRSSRPS